MLSPMEMRIKAAGGGVDALFTFSADAIAGASGYDPRDVGTYVPAAPTTLAVKGIYEKVPQSGVTTDNLGKFMFYCPAEILGMESEDTTVAIGGTLVGDVMTGGILYLVRAPRLRTYLGHIDGYSLDLERGPSGQ